ncbi:MAG: hypothetical protein M1817_002693 [Caeruleum heppii]|nr:MAG: hypothetical protein M1817_002693 [Caeruleum heppii]
MSKTPSNIRVFVEWDEPMVFAGEEIRCSITFKNLTPSPVSSRAGPHPLTPDIPITGAERQRKTESLQRPPPLSRHKSVQHARGGPAQRRGHRPTLSLNVPVRTGSGPASSAPNGSASSHKHKRSVSIISLGADDDEPAPSPAHSAVGRRPFGHGRSASLQVLPRRGVGPTSLPMSPLSGNRAATQPSPLHAPTPPSPLTPFMSRDPHLPSRPPSRSPRSVNPPTTASPTLHRRPSGPTLQSFHFPAAPERDLSDTQPKSNITSRNKSAIPLRPHSPKATAEPSGFDHLAPATRILSGSSMNGGTPRSSGDFHSLSNHSSETLASEYAPQASTRQASRPNHARHVSQLPPSNHQRPPETLMMGYAQVMGSFTVDGSLVNQAPFEDVKRKGVVGGQGGGGVVGVENKRNSGMFGALGWGSIGESLGGLLGGGELSSIKEMRSIASSRSIPVLSTPQSILFVDLRLAPGESRTYRYSFTLPQGLPPTHKGRAIKVSYNLVIGTQRPTAIKEQQVRHVDVPFRILGGVNGRGEILGHDLMSPHVLLTDQARTCSVDERAGDSLQRNQPGLSASKRPKASMQDFLSYVDNLLEDAQEKASGGLLSPTEPSQRRQSSFLDVPSSVKEAIDLALLRSNMTTASNRSTNRFDIARNGRRVAVLRLARPAYRLGETINAVLDFSEADIPCYGVHASLETSETVDPAIALRSSSSIHRVTRKVHASRSECTLFAQRVAFAPCIPFAATPEFMTTGVSLEWKLRVEFITPRIYPDDGSETPVREHQELLEEVAADNRGTVFGAVRDLRCESFEIAVGIRVYGAASGHHGKDDGGGGIHGLAV